MQERIHIAFLGWHEKARCLLEAWGRESSQVVAVGFVLPDDSELPSDIHLPGVHKIAHLEKISPVSCLIDLRPQGSGEPEDIPKTITWIPPEGAALLERLCRQGQTLQRYKDVVETATDAVTTIDESHRILFFNQAAENMFGFKKDEVIGEDLSLIIPEPHKKQHLQYVRRYAESRIGRFIDHTVELTAERRSGEIFPISISFSVSEEAGQLLMTAVIRDVSELKRLQQKALRNERFASMGQALSFVTHEIRNPLVSIGGFARTLLHSQEIQREDRRRLDIIVNEVSRLEELLAEIQDFSKPLVMEKEVFQLNPFLREIMSLFDEDEETQGVRFSLNIRGNPVMWADPDRLRQVILNLIKNAVEAIKRKGEVDVRAWGNSEEITIEVQDNGEGINKEHLAEIFEPFFTTKKGGTGLGLPLCRKIIRDHDGDLAITSKAGRGTTARIVLPFVMSDSEEPSPSRGMDRRVSHS